MKSMKILLLISSVAMAGCKWWADPTPRETCQARAPTVTPIVDLASEQVCYSFEHARLKEKWILELMECAGLPADSP